jgi:hypothetical protein
MLGPVLFGTYGELLFHLGCDALVFYKFLAIGD